MLKRIFAGAGIILLPFIFESGAFEELRLPKAKFLAVMAMLYGACLLYEKVNKWLALFAAYVSLSLYFSSMEMKNEDVVLFWGALVSSFWVTSVPKRQLLFGVKLFVAILLVCCFYGFLQISGLDPLMHYEKNADFWRPTAFFGQHTLFGPYAVSGFVASLFMGWWVPAAIILTIIIKINSSFVLLSLITGTFFWALWRFGWKACAYLCVFCACGFIIFQSLRPADMQEAMDDKGRFMLWRQTLFLSNLKPVFGYGEGSFKVLYPVYQDKRLRELNGIDDKELSPKTLAFIKDAEWLSRMSGKFLSAHNDLLQVYFELGALGIILVALMLVELFRHSRRLWWQREYAMLISIFIAFCANSMGSFSFRLIPQALIPLWIYVIIVTKEEPKIN